MGLRPFAYLSFRIRVGFPGGLLSSLEHIDRAEVARSCPDISTQIFVLGAASQISDPIPDSNQGPAARSLRSGPGRTRAR
jgi:hypothetical protein